MRRFLPFLAFLAAGCGGSGGGTNDPAPFFLLSTRDLATQDVTGGFDLAGDPVGVLFDETTETAKIVNAKRTRTFSVKGRSVMFGLGVQGDYAFFWTFDETSTSDGFLLHTTTGEVVPNFGDVVASDGDRFVVKHDAGAHDVVDLERGTRSSFAVPQGKAVTVLTGDVVLLAKDEGSIPGGHAIDWGVRKARHAKSRDFDDTLHYYSYSTQTVDGRKIADLALPEGMAYVDVRSIDANGQAAGVAFPELNGGGAPSIVRWSREGTPTIIGKEKGDVFTQVVLTSDGRVFAKEDDGGVRVFENGAERRLNLRLQPGDEVEFSPNGRAAMVDHWDYDAHTVTAYRLP